jgi:hypothetical protein
MISAAFAAFGCSKPLPMGSQAAATRPKAARRSAFFVENMVFLPVVDLEASNRSWFGFHARLSLGWLACASIFQA